MLFYYQLMINFRKFVRIHQRRFIYVESSSFYTGMVWVIYFVIWLTQEMF